MRKSNTHTLFGLSTNNFRRHNSKCIFHLKWIKLLHYYSRVVRRISNSFQNNIQLIISRIEFTAININTK